VCTRLAIVLLVLGTVAAAVLVPVSRSLRAHSAINTADAAAPRLSLRLLAAWHSPSSAAAIGGLSALLDERRRAFVIGERTLPSSGVVVLELSSKSALQQAHATLLAAVGDSTGSLAYVLQDFPLTTDFQLSGPATSPQELFNKVWGDPGRTVTRRRRQQRRRLQHHAAALMHKGKRWSAGGEGSQLVGLSGSPGVDRQLLATLNNTNKNATTNSSNSNSSSSSSSSSNSTATAAAATTLNLPEHLQPGGGLDAAAVWAVVEGSPSVVLAVVGSGVEGSHPRLGAALWSNPWEVPGDGIDNDGNGESG